MKLYQIGSAIMTLGMLTGALAFISAIGYGLYMWGGLGMELATSAWSAFVLWLKMIISAMVLVVIGLFFYFTKELSK